MVIGVLLCEVDVVRWMLCDGVCVVVGEEGVQFGWVGLGRSIWVWFGWDIIKWFIGGGVLFYWDVCGGVLK